MIDFLIFVILNVLDSFMSLHNDEETNEKSKQRGRRREKKANLIAFINQYFVRIDFVGTRQLRNGCTVSQQVLNDAKGDENQGRILMTEDIEDHRDQAGLRE